jgi:predicted dehydrogenase
MKQAHVNRRSFLQSSACAAAITLENASPLSDVRQDRQPVAPDATRVLQIGIIGLGARSREHVQLMKENNSACHIAAICDVRDDRLEQTLMACGGNPATYTDYRELLKHPGLDTIVIITPHHLHAPMSIDALDAGYDVLVEKPMALNVAECNQMNAAAHKNKRFLIVTEQHRHMAVNRKAKELIDAGAIGTVLYLWVASFRHHWNMGKKWMNHLDLGGGLLVMESCHDLDAFYYILNSHITRVAGFGGTAIYQNQDTLDHALVIYEYENGVKLSYGFSTTAPGGYKQRVIFGTKGRLEYDRKDKTVYQYTYEVGGRDFSGPIEHDVSREMDEGGHPGTAEMYRDIIQSLRERREAVTAGVGMVESVRVTTAGQDAIRLGTVINVREMTG